jgi:hypothetical protein
MTESTECQQAGAALEGGFWGWMARNRLSLIDVIMAGQVALVVVVLAVIAVAAVIR